MDSKKNHEKAIKIDKTSRKKEFRREKKAYATKGRRNDDHRARGKKVTERERMSKQNILDLENADILRTTPHDSEKLRACAPKADVWT